MFASYHFFLKYFHDSCHHSISFANILHILPQKNQVIHSQVLVLFFQPQVFLSMSPFYQILFNFFLMFHAAKKFCLMSQLY